MSKILRVPQKDFIGYDTDLVERIIRIQMHRAGFDFTKPIKRWTDLKTLEEVFEQEEETIEKPKKRISEFVRTIFQTKRTR